mgnify:CR=1 FL=1
MAAVHSKMDHTSRFHDNKKGRFYPPLFLYILAVVHLQH